MSLVLNKFVRVSNSSLLRLLCERDLIISLFGCLVIVIGLIMLTCIFCKKKTCLTFFFGSRNIYLCLRSPVFARVLTKLLPSTLPRKHGTSNLYKSVLMVTLKWKSGKQIFVMVILFIYENNGLSRFININENAKNTRAYSRRHITVLP